MREAVRSVGEETYRVWRLDMSGSAHAFQTGSISVIQALYSRPDAEGSAHLPPTREDIYRGPSAVDRNEH